MPTIRDYATDNRTTNKIRQSLRSPSGENQIWVLVEGETDEKLFSKLIDGDKVHVYEVNGIKNLKPIIATLEQETTQVIGVRDADFLHLNQQTETITSLFTTDYHDAEMMIISCDNAFSQLIHEYLPNEDFKEVRTKIIKSIIFIATMRWLNELDEIKLNFKNIGLNQFYEVEEELSFKKNDCLIHVLQRSPKKTRAITLDEIETLSATTNDYFNLCQGHDFEKAISFHINQNINDKTIGRELRMNYRKEDFQQTKLYQSLKNWQNHNDQLLFSSL